jgi:hypothetical protein
MTGAGAADDARCRQSNLEEGAELTVRLLPFAYAMFVSHASATMPPLAPLLGGHSAAT